MHSEVDTEGVAPIWGDWSRALWFDCTRNDNKRATVGVMASSRTSVQLPGGG